MLRLMKRINRGFHSAFPEIRLRHNVGRRTLRTRTQTKISERNLLWEMSTLALKEKGSTATFLEIGSFYGASSAVLAAALRRYGRAGRRLFCIDTWDNHAMDDGIRDTWQYFHQTTRRWQDIITPVKGLSHEVTVETDRLFDLIFIDADHTYEGCLADVERFTPRLRDGGILVMHDHAYFHGVTSVVGELLQTGRWYVMGSVNNIIALRRDDGFSRRHAAVPSPTADVRSNQREADVDAPKRRRAEQRPLRISSAGDCWGDADTPRSGQVVLSTYLTGLGDPLRNTLVPPDDASKLELWLPGLVRHNLQGVIFHDRLSDAFVARHSSDHLSFVRVPSPQWMSVNDYRFVVWRAWLTKHPVEAVFFTDLFDVKINRDPFALLDSDHQLWLSTEPARVGDGSSASKWLTQRLEGMYGNVPAAVAGQPILNAGVWGGHYAHVLRALNLMTDELTEDGLPQNSNMSVFNNVMRSRFEKSKLWTQGRPLHSEFKKFENDAAVCFIHK